MKKFLTMMLVLAIAGSMATTVALAAPDIGGVPGNAPEQTAKVLLRVNCVGDGQIAGTDDGSEPQLSDEYPMTSIAFNMAQGATAKLKAKAAEGYKFMFWWDETNEAMYSMDDTIEVKMDEPLSLIAYFDVDAERVLLRGSVYGEGIIAGSMDGSEPEIDEDFPTQSVTLNVIKGETATLTAQPKEGYKFIAWMNAETDELYSLEKTIDVTMNEPLSLVAYFDVDAERFPVRVNVFGSGYIAYSEDGSEPEFEEEHDQSAVVSVISGNSLKVSARAEEGWKFVGWKNAASGEILSTEADLTLEVNEAMDVVAVFEDTQVSDEKKDDEKKDNEKKDNDQKDNDQKDNDKSAPSTPSTGDTSAAAALAALTMGSLGAAVILGKKHRKEQE